jgi:hypothetical protein
MTNDEILIPPMKRNPFCHSSFVIRIFLSLLLLLPACTAKPTAHPDDASIRTFLNRYFSTWSAKDMDGYASCFHPQARIHFVDSSGQVTSEGVTDFLHGQRLAHERATVPMTEKPLEMTIQGDAKVVQAQVTWVLTKGSTENRGTDFFTLKRDPSGWKIVSLVFYGE